MADAAAASGDAPKRATTRKQRKPRAKKPREGGAAPPQETRHDQANGGPAPVAPPLSAREMAAIMSGVPPGEFAPIPKAGDTDATYMYNEPDSNDDEVAKALASAPQRKRKHRSAGETPLGGGGAQASPQQPQYSAQTELSQEPLVEAAPPPPQPMSPAPRPSSADDGWYREDGIFHDFTPLSVEAQTMAAHSKARELAATLSGFGDVTLNQVRSYAGLVKQVLDPANESIRGLKARVERELAELVESGEEIEDAKVRRAAPSHKRIRACQKTLARLLEPSLAAVDELNKTSRLLKKNVATILNGINNCTAALLKLHQSSKQLSSKHRALFRNVTAHLHTSYVFNANTPGSSLLLDPSLPQ